MFIADCQVHIWGANTPERPWTGRVKPHRDVPYGATELLREMQAAGVSRAVLVPPGWEGDNNLLLEAARQHPDRFAVMGRIDLEAPRARELIANWRGKQPGMLGLRCLFTRPPLDAALAEGRVDWLWEEAEKAAIPITVLLPQATAHLINGVAERYPRLRLMIDHMALTEKGATEEESFRHFDNVLALARQPNVAVKASSLPFYASDGYPYRRIHAFLRRAYDAFGPKRVFWGTDLTRLPCSYRQAVTMFTDEIPWFTAEDKEWIMGRGLCTWLGWPLPAA